MRKIMIIALITAALAADIPAVEQLSISLAEVEKSSLSNSFRLKAAREEARGARNRSRAQFAGFLPKLSIDGFYRYNSVVPEITLASPGARAMKLTDNPSYSIGPSVSWMLWDTGATYSSWKSALAAASAKEKEAEVAERQALLAARNAYLQIVLAAEQVLSVSDALKLSQTQYKDIELNAQAGTKSRMDKLYAHQEVLSRSRQLSQARSELAGYIRDLAALTGESYCGSNCVIADGRFTGEIYSDISAPNSVISLDSIETLFKILEPYRGAQFWEGHPGIESLGELAESIRFAEKNSSSNLWPKIQVSARSALDYPNGPKFEEFNQNSVSASLAWPLFDSGLTANRAKENRSARNSALAKKEQAAIDLKRDWEKTMDRLGQLDEQENINKDALREAEELALIVYNTYLNGSVSFIEVQNANYRALEAKLQLARTRVQILMNLSVLASLAK
ncbi:MAG TPA: hypothetical protein DEE98_08640 [Elusimicrobia bacterium]|nr:MAG: hypothetical protein A2278_05230 [Elusimicrobia bacterium RIFOXYA12_FULL_49_49]OGS11861.1 MAG: hypothetical protein A2386_01515 [Elusimicrobia bacterium RIFOXYB1_FULL_48_9]OGS15233.1 MAG: hypothetical protein A2251_06960 [Elusimicrobia bacterium RIFOXYA2_FULL_47_53]OGS25912.1 MAG: hypothetical protein A2339_00845 [Elusimicrobia bacterium RIFOXYB12_FULL_50_12]OGS30284.1 MAG: hypothetical protein A2323_05535 [Elusimicrobia bacterium RIFOXYB2_FULL_46_23]HBU70429.1 hypothetical protein [El